MLVNVCQLRINYGSYSSSCSTAVAAIIYLPQFYHNLSTTIATIKQKLHSLALEPWPINQNNLQGHTLLRVNEIFFF